MILFALSMAILFLVASLYESRVYKREQDYWHKGDRTLNEKRERAIGDKDAKTRLADEFDSYGNPFDHNR
jgi:hypothetical protein